MRFDTFGPIPPGAPLSRRVHERFFRALEREARRQAAGTLEDGAGGVTSRPPEVADLLLSGSAPAYIGQFVQGRPNGLWQSIGSTFATPVYVRNNIAGLAGKVVRATRDQSGVYRATYPRIPPTFHCTLTVTAYGCSGTPGVASAVPASGGPFPGASVTLTLGGITLGPTTTDGAGNAVFTVTTAGTYSIAVTAAGMTTLAGTVDLTTCVGGSKHVWAAMGPDATHVCCNLKQGESTTSCTDMAIPTTLHLTSPFGTIPLTYYTSAPFGLNFGTTPPVNPGWYGCQAASFGSFDPPIWWRFYCTTAALSATPFGLTVTYPIDASYSPGAYYGPCPPAPATLPQVRTDNPTMSGAARAASSCAPLSQLYDGGAAFFGTHWPTGPALVDYPVTVSL